MIWLPDVNVLVALAWPQHVGHSLATRWFDEAADDGWSTCSITESGFMRVSATQRVVSEPVRPRQSRAMLLAARSLGRFTRLSDELDLVLSEAFPADRLVGHRQVTDAHLLALCRTHGATLVTLDKGLLTLARGLSGATVRLLTDAPTKH